MAMKKTAKKTVAKPAKAKAPAKASMPKMAFGKGNAKAGKDAKTLPAKKPLVGY